MVVTQDLKMLPTATALLAAAVLIAGCGQPASDDSGVGVSPAASREMPVVQLEGSEEDPPVDVDDAWKKSEIVLVGTVTSEQGGARVYGPDPDDPHAQWYEDVTLQVEIHDVLKGNPDRPDTIDIQWAAYQTKTDSSNTRIAQLEAGGVTVPQVGKTMVFFLRDFGPPWGLQTTSDLAGVMSVEDDGTVGEVRQHPVPYVPR